MANAHTPLSASSQLAALATGVPTEGNDVLGTSDTIDGLGGNDYLSGSTGAQLLIGGSGNDTLEGFFGPDTLVGGTGDDLYLLGPNSGMDTIENFDTDPNKNDIVYVKGVDASKLTGFQRLGNDLIIKWGTDVGVTLKDAYLDAEHQITALRLYKFQSTSEEVFIPMRDLFEKYGITLTDGDDVLAPSDLSERINAAAGNDLIELGGGNDQVNGGSGNDTLDGGTGNDHLTGNEGDDLFVFRMGDGNDTIDASDTLPGRIDMLRFEDVPVNGLTGVLCRGADMVLQYGASDEVIVKSQFASATRGITHVQFSDGQTLTIEELFQRYPISLSSGNDNVTFPVGMSETVYGGAGNDLISGYGGNDVLHGESGNDTIDGGVGTDLVLGGDGTDNIKGGNDNDSLQGGQGNDSLMGDNGDDLLEGGSEHDTLNGGAGADTLDGGSGNDSMVGDVGNDTFILRAGAGIDRISLVDATANRVDIIRFEDIASSELTAVKRTGTDLVLDYGNGDSVTLVQYFSGASYRFTAIEFSDGQSLDHAHLFARYAVTLGSGGDDATFTTDAETVYGGAGNDKIAGLDGDDMLFGEADNDNLNGGVGADTLFGGAGSDTLSGGAGNDRLDGGAGNDTFMAEVGDDTYVLRVGSGIDTINIGDNTASRIKTLEFEDVSSSELTGVQRVGDNLVLSYGNADQVTMVNHFSGVNFTLNFIAFKDVTWSIADLLSAYPVRLTTGDDKRSFSDFSETIYADAGNDVISANGGSDAVYGEAGNDSIAGGVGNDSLYGGIGNDTLAGDSGDDRLEGGTGDDSITTGTGNDTVVFHAGDGRDTLNVGDATAGRVKTMLFDDIGANNLASLQRVGSDLIVNYTATDKVTVSAFFNGTASVFDTVQFADATWSTQDLFHNYGIALTTAGDNMSFSAFDEIVMGGAGNDSLSGNGGADRLYGEIGNDTLNGGAGADELIGGAGLDSLLGGAGDDQLSGEADNDNLSGEAGNDLLLGGDGNDSLNGGADNDTMYGGAGNDTLAGTAGDDVYVLQLGSGVDTINAYDPTAGRFESLVFEDIQFSQVRSMTKVSNNLVIAYGTSDQVTIANNFAASSYAINAIQFSDGINHTVEELMALFSGARLTASAAEAVVIGSQLDLAIS